MPRPESITARELVRLRVRDEVARYNSTRPEYFRGLVQPTDAEATLNGYRRRRPSRLLALHAFGALTAAAQLRRDALARLLPRTKIADQVQLEERFVRVRGRIGTYRIHLWLWQHPHGPERPVSLYRRG